MKYIALDFEFRESNEFKMDLVCVSLMESEKMKPISLWLHKDPDAYQKLKSTLLKRRDTHTLICFNASAEARSLISLGLDPRKFKWIDLQCEWKMLTNHCDKYRYGNQLIGGIEKTTTRKNYFGDPVKGANHSPPDLSLVAFTYKMLGIKEDLEYKDQIRKEIITTDSFSLDKKQEILTYCESDIKNLFTLKEKVLQIYKEELPTKRFSQNTILEEMLYRGKCAARAAFSEALGIPVNMDKLTRLSRRVQSILDDCSQEIINFFPEIAPFEWDKKWNRMKMNQKNIRNHIRKSKYGPKWERTAKGEISLKLESFTKFFNYKHTYPTDCFYAQMIRFLKLRQSFNGVKGKKGSETVFDSIGKDNRIRPYFNIYRAQSSRFQPKAKSFPFLWAAWIRSVVEPREGYAICGIDYSSQEFLVSALLSKDKAMIEAYTSGDPYTYIAKKAGAIPEDGNKKTHPIERNIFKTVTLGISYAMTKVGLSRELTLKLKRPFSEADAQKLISQFYKIFPEYYAYTKAIQKYYAIQKHIKLPDGFYMFGGNPNERSVGNMPIQGTAACILRKAIELCQERGLKVIMPLHDALYVEGPREGWRNWVDTFQECMVDAFTFYFPNQPEAKQVRCDIDLWGPGINSSNGVKTVKGYPVALKDIYIDGRAIAEYEKFSKYFTPMVGITKSQKDK